MSEDTIRVEIDDAEVDAVIAKLKQVLALTDTTLGRRDLPSAIRVTNRELRLMGDLTEQTREIPRLLDEMGMADLPSINREMRLIAGQVPGMNMLMATWFRIRRIQLSIAKGTAEAESLREFLLHPQVVLTILATAILLIRMVLQHQERIRRERRDYERLIRSYKGWTHEEFETEMSRRSMYVRRFPG